MYLPLRTPYSFSKMNTIPRELLVDVFRRIARRGFRELGPFISGSKESKSVVMSREVLSVVDLFEFMIDSSMANMDSIYRNFFASCVQYGNVMANQLEGLRILCQEGPADAAFDMLRLSPPNSIYAAVVIGLFQICAGDFESGMGTLSLLWDIADSCEEAVHIADMIIMQIARLGPARSGMYYSSYSYPYDYVPHCVHLSCAADNVCVDCFGFWYSLMIRSMC